MEKQPVHETGLNKSVAFFGVVISSIVGIGALIYAILVLTGKMDRTGVEGTVKELKCSSVTKCNVFVEYIYQGTTYTKWMDSDDSIKYTVGMKVTVYLVPDDPTDARLTEPPTVTTAIIFLCVGILLLVLSLLWYQVVYKGLI